MDPRIPAIIHPLIQDYTRCVTQKMPERIAAFYLVGSIALEGFNPRLSDIDFVSILSIKATTDDFKNILEIHKSIEQRYPKWKFEGMYFQQDDLGCPDYEVEPFLNYHNGKLIWSDRFGLSSVTWWILKNRGIAIFGPSPQILTYTVNTDYLIQTLRENLNSYWVSWTTRLDRILALFSDWGIQWTILGLLRQFYTFRERQITSKIKSGEYALAYVPDCWHPIIREAIILRKNPKQSHYHSRLTRAIEAFRFLKYIIRSCNEHLDASQSENMAV